MWQQQLFLAPLAYLVSGTIAATLLYALTSPGKFWKKISQKGADIPIPFDKLAAIVAPILYIAITFILILLYNDVIAALRFDGSADAALATADARLLGGASVIEWAHAALRLYPNSFTTMEWWYFALYPLIAACIVTIALSEGTEAVFRYVGAGLTASYIALLLFWFVPAIGPFYLDHSSLWPKRSLVYTLQVHAVHLHRGFRPEIIGTDYFVAFPCMHLVDALLMSWFTRKNRALSALLAVYAAVLIPCVFLLEEHYIVDVLAAFPVAALAVWMVSGTRQTDRQASRHLLKTA